MYTQCSTCETVFRLSAEVLRAAGGQVRCGRCGEVFNALASLAEDPGTFTTHDSSHELETRANEILESSAVAEAAADDTPADDDEGTPGIEVAHLHILEPNADDPAAADDELELSGDSDGNAPIPASEMEFTLPPGELDRIFVESRAGVMKSAAVAPHTGAAPVATEPAATESPADVTQSVEVDDAALSAAIAAADEEAAARARTAAEMPPPIDRRKKPLTGIEVPENVRQAMLSGYSKKAAAAEAELDALSRPRVPRVAWLGGGFVLAVCLSVQLIHANRDWLAEHAPLRGTLSAVYGALGVNTSTLPNLSAYQLRQWGVTGDPATPGTLRVRASVLNTGAQLQPFPLLRVTLANRFGAKISSREFKADEYMGKPLARMMAPGEQADATMDILDPGKDAEGFEIDVCLRGTDQKLACASDAAARKK